MPGPLQSLDYIYTPSSDVARDRDYFEKVLGADVVFAIDGMGTRVAMIRFGDGAPLLLADHLKGDVPILVYRVAGLKPAIAELEGRGWKRGRMIELPSESRIIDILHTGEWIISALNWTFRGDACLHEPGRPSLHHRAGHLADRSHAHS